MVRYGVIEHLTKTIGAASHQKSSCGRNHHFHDGWNGMPDMSFDKLLLRRQGKVAGAARLVM